MLNYGALSHWFLIRQFLSAFCSSSQLFDVFAASLVHKVHTIWLDRNAIRLSFANVSLHASMAKISSFVAMFGANSKGNCVVMDEVFLNNFLITPSYRLVREIMSVIWKPPTITWVKANIDGSVLNLNSSCGGIFRDFRGTYLGGFACNLGHGTVFEAGLTGLMFAMEYAASHNWSRLWLESDSSTAIQAFKDHSIIPLCLRNRWYNCMQLDLMVICSHIYREVTVVLTLWLHWDKTSLPILGSILCQFLSRLILL